MLARTRQVFQRFVRARRARAIRRGRTVRLLPGVVASLLLTAVPALAAKPTHDIQTQHSAAGKPARSTRDTARGRETGSARHAALHRRGRAYAGSGPSQQEMAENLAGAEIADVDAPAAALASAKPPIETKAPLDTKEAGTVGFIARGTASWYDIHGNGLRTSSGERFDENAMTAAHPWLPLGTRVRVTVVGSDASIVVTINDRQGTRSRVIDLSKGAARELGILSRGLATVTLTRA